MTSRQSPVPLTATTLTPVVRRALDNPAIAVIDWSVTPLAGGAGMFANTYRVSGSGADESQNIAWSVVLKICRSAPSGADSPSTEDWRREALAYQSGLLDQHTSGLVAARCYGVTDQSDTEVWLWLEDVVDSYGAAWPLTRYAVAGQHLGAFNGFYLTQEQLPSAPWLSRHWLESWLAATAPVMAQFEDLLSDRLAQHLYPLAVARAYQQIWTERTRLLDALNRLPQTICHRDAFRRNLFARQDERGQEQTVAIDWADVGIGAVGEELAPLVLAAAQFNEIAVADLPELDRIAFAGYMAGLREAGWQGDEKLARLGYTATAILRYGVGAIQFLPLLLQEEARRQWEHTVGQSFEELTDSFVVTHQFLLGLANEVQTLVKAVS